MTRLRTVCAYSSVILLGAGILIYVYFRQNVGFLDCVRSSLPQERCLSDTAFDVFVRDNLADGLWYAALIAGQCACYRPTIVGKVVFLLSLMLPFMMEYMQFEGIVYGTGDVVDLLTYLWILIIFIILLCVKFYISSSR